MISKRHELVYDIINNKATLTMKMGDYPNDLDFFIKLTNLNNQVDLRNAKVILATIKPDNSIEVQYFINTNQVINIALKQELRNIIGTYKAILLIQDTKQFHVIDYITYQITKLKQVSQIVSHLGEQSLLSEVLLKLKPIVQELQLRQSRTRTSINNEYQQALKLLNQYSNAISRNVSTEETIITTVDHNDQYETIRKQNELQREKSEKARKIAEDERIANEAKRQHFEEERKNSFDVFLKNCEETLETVDYINSVKDDIFNLVEQETIRNNNENKRKANELERIANEEERLFNERVRISDESTRQSNEHTRQVNENTRQSIESIRVANEDVRKANELERIANENARVDADEERAEKDALWEANEQERQEKFEELLEGWDDSSIGKIAALESSQLVQDTRLQEAEEKIEKLEKNERRQDILIQGLLAENSDKRVTITETDSNFSLDYSIDKGLAIINSIEGNTLVNVSKEKSNIITNELEASTEKIVETTSQVDEQVRPVITGNTLVNVSNQEDNVLITNGYEVLNTNHVPLDTEVDTISYPIIEGNTLVNHNADWNGNLQTGTELNVEGASDVLVEGTKGQEVSVVVEGNTVLNHALGKTSAVVDGIEENLFNGNTYHGLPSSLPVKPLTTYTIIATCLLDDATSENTGQFNYCFFSDETTHYNHVMLVFYANIQVGEQFRTTIVTDENCKYIGVYNNNTNFIMGDVIILEGDHTTNPKYVKSNEGNYVDLTVANDMSSVVEIEGRTMVNVCDQKDPIAITKSYTVENSGNHIALQGEYDGKCRPVIQGNTMVNLFNISDISKSQGMSIDNDIITLTEENAWAYLESHIPTLKPSTLYTFVVNIIENTTNDIVFINNVGEGETYFPEIPWKSVTEVGTYTYTATTASDLTNLRYSVRTNSGGTGYVKLQIMLFEGDLTQTPELIPTEYVEGLKNSFEDNLVTQEMVDSGEESSENLGKYKVEYKVTGKNKCSSQTNFKGYYSAPWTNGSSLHWNDSDTARTTDYIHVKPNTTYVISGKDMNRCGVHFFRDNQDDFPYNGLTVDMEDKSRSFTTDSLCNYIRVQLGGSVSYEITDIQLEEGTTATEYEPYKEYTKTFYLNSPLLEGDTIEDINGVATHVRRHKKITMGSGENWYRREIRDEQLVIYLFSFDADISDAKPIDREQKVTMFCDRLVGQTLWGNVPDTILNKQVYYNANRNIWSIKNDDYTNLDDFKGWLSEKPVTVVYPLASPIYEPIGAYGKVVLDGSENWGIESSINRFNVTIADKKVGGDFHVDRLIPNGRPVSDSTLFDLYPNSIGQYSDRYYVFPNAIHTLDSFKQWLSENPVTVIYELAEPQYQGSILCDSYVNGHLDFDSAVPVEKVQFKQWWKYVKYLKPNTTYTIQFESDNVGESAFAIGGKSKYTIVTKGLNKVNITTGDTIPNSDLWTEGIGFNASNIVVTEATDADFDYFEGLSSSYESCYPGGKNLFDGVWIIGEGIDASTGLPWVGINRNRTDFIEIKPNTNYVASGASVTTSRFYDKNKQIIPNNTGINKKSPSNAKYLRISIDNTVDFSKFQLEEGSTATSYEPFIDKYKVDVKVTGKNLFDGNLTRGQAIGSLTGEISSSSTKSLSNYIKIKNNTSYILSNCARGGLCFYDANFMYIGGIERDYTFTTPNNAHYLRFNINNTVDYTQLQLEEGTEATTYEPYFESTKKFYLNSPLLEGDKIVTKNGKVYHYHKMGMVVLDGSEDWGTSVINQDNKTFRNEYIIENLKFIQTDTETTIECDTLIPLIFQRLFTGNYQGIAQYQDKSIIISNNFSNVEQLKQWLQANPTTVIYELATPYYELIDEYNNTILNIPNTVAHLTHTSAVPVNNTVFTNYKDELNVLEANTQYRLMFDCDTANVPFTVTLGGTSQEVISKKGTHSLLITTPSELVDKNLVIDGIGRCGIDNIRIFKGDVEYDYVKGLWSGYEERRLVNYLPSLREGSTLFNGRPYYITGVYSGHNCSLDIENNMLTINTGTCPNIIYVGVSLRNVTTPLKEGVLYTIVFNLNFVRSLVHIGNTDYASSSTRQISLKHHGNIYCCAFTFESTDKYMILNAYKNDNNNKTIKNVMILEGDWTDNPPTYEEVMANEGKYAVKVKLDTNANIFGKGGRL